MYHKLTILNDIDDITEHLLMNGYDVERVEDHLYILEDELDYVKTMLKEHKIRYTEGTGYLVVIWDTPQGLAENSSDHCVVVTDANDPKEALIEVIANAKKPILYAKAFTEDDYRKDFIERKRA